MSRTTKDQKSEKAERKGQPRRSLTKPGKKFVPRDFRKVED